MRITKQIAEDVALRLCAERKAEITNLKNQLRVTAQQHYEKVIPKDVLSFFKKHPKWVNTQSSTRIIGAGIDYRYFNFMSPMPYQGGEKVEVTDDEANFITDLINSISDKESEYNKLKNEIELALVNLRTYKNVHEQFLEAGKLLPIQNTSTTVMVNIKDIRCKLDKVNC